MRDRLIEEDPKSAEIIRPILRGKDIQRYGYRFAEKYLIATFPSKGYDIDAYPSVKAHLLTFDERVLSQTGEKDIDGIMGKNARKRTNNKWFETQDAISYWDDFNRLKLVYAETMRVHRAEGSDRFPRFSMDSNGYFTDKTCFIMVGNHLKFILSVLNSGLSKYVIKNSVAVMDQGGFLMQKIYIENFPIPKVSPEVMAQLELLVDRVLEERTNGLDSTASEKEIDEIVYAVFGFNSNEIKIIESSL